MAGGAPRSPFARIVSTAVAAGLLAGLVLTAVQTVQIAPTILQAETYEDAAAPVAHVHADAHEHEHTGWKPENGTERTAYTVLANVSIAVTVLLTLLLVIVPLNSVRREQASPDLGLAPQPARKTLLKKAARRSAWVLMPTTRTPTPAVCRTPISLVGGTSQSATATLWR